MFLLNLFFPKTCEYCGKIGSYICDECYEKYIKKYELNYQTKDKFFLYKYEGEIRELLLKYKFRDKSYLRDFFSDVIIKNKNLCIFLNKYDIITPVPLHKKRKLERGYNQTEQILNSAFYKINTYKNSIFQNHIIYDNKILIKTKNIKPQSTKNADERKENIKNAFIIKDENAINKIKGKNILVFDDIYTTGSTFKECKKVLMKPINNKNEEGAKNVGALIIAKD